MARGGPIAGNHTGVTDMGDGTLATSRVLGATAQLLEDEGWKRFGSAGRGHTVLEALDLVSGLYPEWPIDAWDGAIQQLAETIGARPGDDAEAAISAWQVCQTSRGEVLRALRYAATSGAR